jgi:hypothetical protein
MEQVDTQVAKGVPSGYDVNDPNYPEGALGRPEEKASRLWNTRQQLR